MNQFKVGDYVRIDTASYIRPEKILKGHAQVVRVNRIAYNSYNYYNYDLLILDGKYKGKHMTYHESWLYKLSPMELFALADEIME